MSTSVFKQEPLAKAINNMELYKNDTFASHANFQALQ